MEDQLQELSQFLRLETRLDVKSIALEYVLGLTASEEGRTAISKRDSILASLVDLTTDKVPGISRDAYLALVNLSGHEEFASRLIDMNITAKLVELLTSVSAFKDADSVCMILTNLTRLSKGAEHFMTSLESAVTLYKLVDLFDKRDSVHGGSPLHYLATVFSNVTTTASARLMFLDKQVCIIPRLLPYMHYKESAVRRGGIVGLVRNLCFETSYHSWLLSPEIDVLSYLLLPLAGPEQFSDEENDSLPLDLQYLPDDKERECYPDIRKMLLEALLKLCATKEGRLYLRDKNTYLILRELDRWEDDSVVTETCQNVIGILIADEPEPGMENLDKVEIPPDVIRKFTAGHEQQLQDGCGQKNKYETEVSGCENIEENKSSNPVP